jgi:hypothetical protein
LLWRGRDSQAHTEQHIERGWLGWLAKRTLRIETLESLCVLESLAMEPFELLFRDSRVEV